jgi:steroid delta-isomerase-like uncharacterized protein
MGANLQLVNKALAAYNAGDIETFCSYYADDAVYTSPDGVYKGREAILDAWLGTKEAFPDGRVDVTLQVDDGSCVVSEWTFTATNTGPITMPDGAQTPATGHTVEVQGMDITEIRDGRITSHRMYFDNVAAFTQLGLMPAPA